LSGKIVFFGSAPFAVPSLEAVWEHCSLVVSQPAKPTGRGMSVSPTPVARRATEGGIPVETPVKCRAPEFIERLAAEEADLFVVAAYGQILPQGLLDLPRFGCINVHGSLLPRWRGAAPVQRAVQAGDGESGVTLMKMDAGLDTGPMIAKAQTPISPDETAGELYERLAHLGGELLAEWLPRLMAGDYPTEEQDDALATLAPKVKPEEGQLLASESASMTYDRFRGMTPAPGAFLVTKFGRLKVKEMALGEEAGEPGVVLATKPALVIGWTGGSLHLRSVQAEGKRAMSGTDFANGARLRAGDGLL